MTTQNVPDAQPGEDKYTFRTFIENLRKHDIATVQWMIWYDSDENHFDDDPTVIDRHGNQIDVSRMVKNDKGGYDVIHHPGFVSPQTKYRYENMETWREILWELGDKFGDTGVFVLDVQKSTLTRIADAYIPEDHDIEIDNIDPEQFQFSIEPEEPIWEGPFHPSWSEADKSSPYKVQYWADPDGFNPDGGWNSRGKVLKPGDKPGWQEYGEVRYINEGIHYALSFFQNGSNYGQVIYPENGQKLSKGKTAARVVDAWGQEVFLINKKGVIRDNRKPFKIQTQWFKTGYPRLSSKNWNDSVKGRPWNHKFPDNFQSEYDNFVEAIAVAKEYAKLNEDRKEFACHVRVVDNAERIVEMIYEHIVPEYSLRMKNTTVYHLANKPISEDKVLVEVSISDLWTLSAEIKRFDQFNWVKKMAEKYYSDTAHTVSVEVDSEYDDQGRYYDSITGISVSDEAGMVLSYDKDKLLAVLKEDPSYWNDVMKEYRAQRDGHYEVGDDGYFDWNDPDTFTFKNEDFYEYIIYGDLIDDIMNDEYSDVDQDDLGGDYVLNDPPALDERWKGMRLFALSDIVK